MPRFVRFAALLTCTAVALAGCGGDDGADSASVAASTPPATNPSVAQQAAADAAKKQVAPTDAGPAKVTVDDNSSAPTINGETAATSKADKEHAPDWVKQANARCVQYKQLAAKNAKEFEQKAAKDPKAITEAMASAVPIARDLLRDLRQINVPSDAQGPWNAFLGAFESTFDYASKFAKAQAEGKTPPKQDTSDATKLGKSIQELLAKYPLSDCVPA